MSRAPIALTTIPMHRSGAAHSRRVRLPRRGNNRLALVLKHVLYDGNLLGSSGKESTVLHFFDADHCGVVLHKKGIEKRSFTLSTTTPIVAVCPTFRVTFRGSNRICADCPPDAPHPLPAGSRRRYRRRRIPPSLPPRTPLPTAPARHTHASPARSLPIRCTALADSPSSIPACRTMLGVKMIRISSSS